MDLTYVDTILAFSVVMLLLSLFVTIAVQTVVEMRSLRGNHLIWGLERILERCPSLRDHAATLAQKIVLHPAVANEGKPANAIGSRELLVVLKALAEGNSLEPQLRSAVSTALAQVVPAEAVAHADQLKAEFRTLFPAEAAKLEEALAVLTAKASRLTVDFDTWFGSVMSRVTDRFVRETRQWSIGLAAVLALGLQIDSFDLIRTISRSPEVRASLLAVAESTRARADALRVQNERAAPAGKTENAPVLDGRAVNAGGALQPPAAQPPAAGEATRLTREQLVQQLDEIRAELERSGLVVLPSTWAEYKARWDWQQLPARIPGIVLSVLLLSLGAPFWFNLLSSVAKLRPALAGLPDPSKADAAKPA